MRRRRGVLLAGGAALLVIAAAVIWLRGSSDRPISAEEAATTYLRALESGDPAAVESTGIDVSDAALTAFRDAEALIEDAEVVSVDQEGRTATAQVTFTLDGTPHEATLSLARESDRWRLGESALGALTPSTAIGDSVRIGDAVLPASERLALVPAAYAVTAAPPALLSGANDAVVLPGAATEIAIDAALRPAATEAAQEQLDALLETCASSSDPAPEGCGIRLPWGAEFRTVAEVSYRIDAEPVIRLEPDGFTSDGGVLVATVTGTGLDGAERTATYRTEDWSVRGDATFTGTGIVLDPW
ncbi:hypothetical protein [Microbacterium sp. 179-I 3D4 NHS]|uniref:hypothetical protein n=1 Tax=Microbacterium sp. 179-I 3D4 NHS TaxID=3142381 RepID=UPI0039A12DF2